MPETFEQLVTKVASLTDEITTLKTAAKKGENDDDKDEQMEAFKKAQEEMDEEHKDATTDMDDMDRVKEAFKKAAEEDDEDKKMEAMKKAQEMKDEHDDKMSKKARKHAKKGQNDDDDEEKPTTNVEATKIAALESEIALPTINKILEAAKIVDPSGIPALEKKLKTASLKQIKTMWSERKPFIAALGIGTIPNPTNTQPGFIPFQAAWSDESPEEQDFAKMDSEKLLSEMYR